MWFGDVEKFERDCLFKVRSGITNINEYHVMKPQGYQEAFASLVEADLCEFKIDFPDVFKHGLGWVIISFNVEVVKPINKAMWIYGSTWFSQKRGPYYRRDFLFQDENGELLFHGTTYNILLNIETRKIFRQVELPFYLDPPHPEFRVDGSPAFREKFDYEDIMKGTVCGSDIDMLGHMNNTRYGAFAYDIMTAEERKRLEKLRRMELYFEGEMKEGDEYMMQKTYNNDDLLIRCKNLSKDTKSFDMILKFND
ncbi:MAG: hypothetical protein IJO79_01560 [Firmicutes bacterium]|nr:hypothetical protein [Bacillota bacterium]